MSKYFSIPFATSGDKTTVPDPLQGSGVVSYTEGWTSDYELDQLTDPNAKDVDRQAENQLKFDITEAIKEIQEYGLLVYRADVNYPLDAKVTGSDGETYKCLIVNGPASTVVDPVGDVTGTWLFINEGSISISNLLHIQHQTADGVDGGPITSNTWNTAPLNTVLTNNITGASLSSNQVTLPAGNYFVLDSYSCAFNCGSNQAKLQDTTGATELVTGESGRSFTEDGGQEGSRISGEFSLSVSSVLEIQHNCSSNKSTDGFGNASSFSTVTHNVYRNLMIYKVA